MYINGNLSQSVDPKAFFSIYIFGLCNSLVNDIKDWYTRLLYYEKY